MLAFGAGTYSSLPLLVLGVLANNPNHSTPTNNLALRAYLLH
jgi:hypothetical protein